MGLRPAVSEKNSPARPDKAESTVLAKVNAARILMLESAEHPSPEETSKNASCEAVCSFLTYEPRLSTTLTKYVPFKKNSPTFIFNLVM